MLSDDLKITTLIENHVSEKKLMAEHGFSLYIQKKGEGILFDTGQSPHFISNSKELGIDPASISACIISHGHYDHTGGLHDFMKINSTAPIWLNEKALIPKFNKKNQNIGIPNIENLDLKRIRVPEGITTIMEDVHILPASPLFHKNDNHTAGLFIEKNGIREVDDFQDEQSLVIVKDQSLIIISGCSHRGISNIIKHAIDSFKLPVSLVLGGFHLKNESTEKVNELCEVLNSFQIKRMGISHCTGIEKYNQLKNRLNTDLFYNETGSKLFL